jgi:biopolymer transport protein ExbD
LRERLNPTEAEARIAVKAEAVAVAEAETVAETVAEAEVQSQSDSQRRAGPARPGITLKADADVTQGQLRQLLKQLHGLGIERLQLLSQQPN